MPVLAVKVCVVHEVVSDPAQAICSVGAKAQEQGIEPECWMEHGTVEYGELPQSLLNGIAVLFGSGVGYVITSLWLLEGGGDGWSLSTEHVIAMLGLSLITVMTANRRRPDQRR